jgi:hypothetical protein
MSTLAEKLDAIREGGKKRISEERRAVMTAATERLRASGILERTVKAGDPLPPFSLENQAGRRIESGDLLGRGPVVLTVFRGSW